MFKRIKNRKGLTVIELIIAISLASIIIVISINLLRLTNKTHSLSLEEYDMQSSVRRAVEETNQIVRYSKGVFAVPQTFVAGTDKMDPDWNFLMVSPDGKRIVSMEYDEENEEFTERVLVPEQKNIRYEVFFEKDSKATADNVMKYVINAYIVDKNGNIISEKIAYETTVESINALQVVDKGTGIPEEGIRGAAPSLALAYRSGGHTSGKGRKDFAYITLIVDVSGSMRLLPTDIDANVSVPSTEKSGSRIQKVREALNGTTGWNAKEGIIQKFEKEEHIYVSLVPFSTTANYPEPTVGTQSAAKHPIYDLYGNKVYSNNNQHKSNLKDEIIDKLEADGGTNTGDGLRRAYYLHEDFRTTMNISDNDKVHHYMILLVDGQTTYELKERKWVDGGKYKKFTSSSIFGNTKTYYEWVTDWKKTYENYYTEPGNVNIKLENTATKPKDEPTGKPSWNSNIKDGAYYGSENDDVEYIAITGTGRSFAGTGYVNVIGKELIQNFENKSGIKSYVIGYATGLTRRVEEIGEGIGTGEGKIYSYDEEYFDLDEVFQNIADDILADFWVVAGPQIQNPQIQIH